MRKKGEAPDIIKIKEPYWKYRAVGLAEYKLTQETTKIRILYKDKYDNLLFPYIYKMQTARIWTYPQMKVGNGMLLRIVPISDFEVVEVIEERGKTNGKMLLW